MCNLQIIYSNVESLIIELNNNGLKNISKDLESALYCGCTSGEILDNLISVLKEIKKYKNFNNISSELLRKIKNIKK